jgi:hypothetical protein
VILGGAQASRYFASYSPTLNLGHGHRASPSSAAQAATACARSDGRLGRWPADGLRRGRSGEHPDGAGRHEVDRNGDAARADADSGGGRAYHRHHDDRAPDECGRAHDRAAAGDGDHRRAPGDGDHDADDGGHHNADDGGHNDAHDGGHHDGRSADDRRVDDGSAADDDLLGHLASPGLGDRHRPGAEFTDDPRVDDGHGADANDLLE